METKTQTIFDAAQALPESERALLVERLLETLSPEPAELSEEEMVAELDSRRKDLEAGTAEAIPWSELKKED